LATRIVFLYGSPRSIFLPFAAYRTVTEKETVRVAPLDEACTLTENVLGCVPEGRGGLALLLLPPPPQLAVSSTAARTAAAATVRHAGRRERAPRANPSKASRASTVGISGRYHSHKRGSGGSAARAVVVTVSVALAGVVPSIVTLDGVTLHVVVAGAPLHVKETEPLNPADPARFVWKVADSPAFTVAEVELPTAAMGKSVPIPEIATELGFAEPLCAMVREAAQAPASVGRVVTVMAQLAPGYRLAPQLSETAK